MRKTILISLSALLVCGTTFLAWKTLLAGLLTKTEVEEAVLFNALLLCIVTIFLYRLFRSQIFGIASLFLLLPFAAFARWRDLHVSQLEVFSTLGDSYFLSLLSGFWISPLFGFWAYRSFSGLVKS